MRRMRPQEIKVTCPIGQNKLCQGMAGGLSTAHPHPVAILNKQTKKKDAYYVMKLEDPKIY